VVKGGEMLCGAVDAHRTASLDVPVVFVPVVFPAERTTILLLHIDGMPDGDPGEFNDKLSQLLGFLAEQFQFIGWCGTRPGRSTILRPSGRKLGVGHFGSPRESLETKFGSK
jgi:hypothetical protein